MLTNCSIWNSWVVSVYEQCLQFVFADHVLKTSVKGCCWSYLQAASSSKAGLWSDLCYVTRHRLAHQLVSPEASGASEPSSPEGTEEGGADPAHTDNFTVPLLDPWGNPIQQQKATLPGKSPHPVLARQRSRTILTTDLWSKYFLQNKDFCTQNQS